MNKIFMLGHSARRFQSDVSPVMSDRRERSVCPECEVPLGSWSEPFLYEWDYEFGDPETSLRMEHDCFWGDFELLVSQAGLVKLGALELQLRLLESRLIKFTVHRSVETITYLPEQDLHFAWVVPSLTATATKPRSAVCPTCNRFIDPPRQLVSLQVKRCDATEHGIFRVSQNEGGPTFVTEKIKDQMLDAAITGIAFYPGGKLVD